MKVLYIQDSLGTGGAERSNAELWYCLREVGVEIKIVVLEHRKEGIESEILENGFDVIFLKPGTFVNQVMQIKDVIQEFNPDLVHSVLFRAAIRTRSAKLLVKFKNIESLVNPTYAEIRYRDPKINSWVLKLYEKVDKLTGGPGVDHYIAITEEVGKHYQEHLNIRPEKISVIYRGRKQNNYLLQKQKIKEELTKELELNPNGPIFIHVGRQEFQKAHLDILKAIQIVDNHLWDAGAQFLFCGRRGNASGAIEQFLNENNIKTEIKFLGHRSDIYRLLAASDVFVFPSLFEGLGGSLIEAQAAGLPIICSNLPVFNEVVTEKNALFHKVNDPKSLSEKFLKILTVNRKEMGENSIKNYKEKFQLEKVNHDMLNFYKNLL